MDTNTVAWSASAAVLLQTAQYYSTIIVENNSTATVWVTTDGSVPAAGVGTAGYPVAAGTTKTFENPLNRPNADQNNAFKFGWTTQQNDNTYTGGFGTNVNVIGGTEGTASGNETITAWAQ